MVVRLAFVATFVLWSCAQSARLSAPGLIDDKRNIWSNPLPSDSMRKRTSSIRPHASGEVAPRLRGCVSKRRKSALEQTLWVLLEFADEGIIYNTLAERGHQSVWTSLKTLVDRGATAAQMCGVRRARRAIDDFMEVNRACEEGELATVAGVVNSTLRGSRWLAYGRFLTAGMKAVIAIVQSPLVPADFGYLAIVADRFLEDMCVDTFVEASKAGHAAFASAWNIDAALRKIQSMSDAVQSVMSFLVFGEGAMEKARQCAMSFAVVVISFAFATAAGQGTSAPTDVYLGGLVSAQQLTSGLIFMKRADVSERFLKVGQNAVAGLTSVLWGPQPPFGCTCNKSEETFGICSVHESEHTGLGCYVDASCGEGVKPSLKHRGMFWAPCTSGSLRDQMSRVLGTSATDLAEVAFLFSVSSFAFYFLSASSTAATKLFRIFGPNTVIETPSAKAVVTLGENALLLLKTEGWAGCAAGIVRHYMKYVERIARDSGALEISTSASTTVDLRGLMCGSVSVRALDLFFPLTDDWALLDKYFGIERRVQASMLEGKPCEMAQDGSILVAYRGDAMAERRVSSEDGAFCETTAQVGQPGVFAWLAGARPHSTVRLLQPSEYELVQDVAACCESEFLLGEVVDFISSGGNPPLSVADALMEAAMVRWAICD